MASSEEKTKYIGVTSTSVPVDWVPIATEADLTRPCRAIRCDSGGTMTVKLAQSDDTERVLIWAAGETRYGVFIEIVDLNGCTGVEAGI